MQTRVHTLRRCRDLGGGSFAVEAMSTKDHRIWRGALLCSWLVALTQGVASQVPNHVMDLRSMERDIVFAKRADARVALVGSWFGPTNNVALPFDRNGSLDTVSAPERLVVCGQDSVTSTGYVVFLDKGAGGVYAVASAATLPGRFPVGICTSKALAKMFLLDATQQQLLWADFVGVGGVPTAWAPVPGSQDLACLADAATLGLVIETEDASVAAVALARPDGSGAVHRVAVAAQGVLATLSESEPAVIVSEFLRPADTSLMVLAEPGRSVELVRMDTPSPVVVGSGQVAQGGVGSVQFSAPPGYGWMVGVRYVGELKTRGPYLGPLGRVGVPDAIDSATRIRPLAQAISLTLYRGHQFFQVPLFLEHTGVAAPVIADYPAYLGVGDPSQILDVGGAEVPVDERLAAGHGQGLEPEDAWFRSRQDPVGR
ncbi:MAG: hypothetical protein K8J09_15205 [Planctomycetes bacterium]|nr:hypothetical protein [Planctomycetota bacterium]MCC7397856.1 hypothetical protein [Planctomycetota bacterium]